MNFVAGLLLASGLVAARPVQVLAQSPYDAGGVGAMGLIGRGVVPEERPAATGTATPRAAPVYLPAPVVVPATGPTIAPGGPPRAATPPVVAAGRFGPAARAAAVVRSRPAGDNAPARRAALARDNPYLRYDRGWLHGYWELPRRPSTARGDSRAVAPQARPGVGSGWGLPAWLIGPMVYRWGYDPYENPFIEAAGEGREGPRGTTRPDEGMPPDLLAPPPTESVLREALVRFRAAREAFRRADYTRALRLADAALERLPNDASIHEFRGLTLLALHRYREAAAALYAAIAVVPGWDWPTLLNLYGDPETYTRQLRVLESDSERNPRSAAVHFLLAVQYLTTGYPEAAAGQLREAAALRPGDSLIARLIRALQGPDTAAVTTAASETGESGELEGTWVARPRAGTTITLVIQPLGHLSWRISERGRVREYQGFGLYTDGVLTLSQDADNALVGRITWRDPRHFDFTIAEGRPGDPGLSFAKSS